MRKFQSGATRETDTYKIDPEATLSPLVLIAYCEYVRKHRLQSDGKLRSDDNWQKGIPLPSYMKSLLRHVLEAWRAYRANEPINEALFGVMFNAMGMLHEILKKKLQDEEYARGGMPWFDVETGEPIPNETKTLRPPVNTSGVD